MVRAARPTVELGSVLAAVLLAVSGASPELSEGRELYRAMRYRLAEEPLRAAAARPENSRAERYEAHDLLARALAAQGKLEEAEAVWGELLAKDPNAPPPDKVAPKISEAYRRAKVRLYPPEHVVLAPLATGPDALELEVQDPWEAVAALTLKELDGAQPERALERKDGRALLELRSVPPGRYVVEARSAAGALLAQLGSSERPLVLGKPPAPAPVAAKEAPPPLPRPAPPRAVEAAPPVAAVEAPPPRWVAWTLAGLAVLAGGAGGALAASSSSDALRAVDAGGAPALVESAHQKALGANVLVGGAVVAGVGSGILFWRWR